MATIFATRSLLLSDAPTLRRVIVGLVCVGVEVYPPTPLSPSDILSDAPTLRRASDWYGHYVLDWSLSTMLEVDFCVDTVGNLPHFKISSYCLSHLNYLTKVT